MRVCVSIDAKLQPSQTIIHQSQENIITSTPQQLFLNITNILEEGNIHVDWIGIRKLDTLYKTSCNGWMPDQYSVFVGW